MCIRDRCRAGWTRWWRCWPSTGPRAVATASTSSGCSRRPTPTTTGRGLIELLEALEFGSTNTAHAPVIEALALIKRYKAEHTPSTQYYARGERVPVEGVVPAELTELMYRTDKRGQQRILRSVYECGVFQTLRDKLRCKEIWVARAEKWRNPDEDLPKDFEANRAENYAALSKPLDPTVFAEQVLD